MKTDMIHLNVIEDVKVFFHTHLPEDIAIRACRNISLTGNFGISSLQEESSILTSCFVWNRTPEGGNFWGRVDSALSSRRFNMQGHKPWPEIPQ